MARRRRQQTSLSELAFGLFSIAIIITVLNPKARQQIFSTVTTIVAFLLILAILGGVAYLIWQMRKSQSEPILAAAPSPDIPPAPIHPPHAPDNYIHKAVQQAPMATAAIARPPVTRSWDISLLQEIEWRRFERVCTEFLRMKGYTATETKIGADGGVDIRIHKPGRENSVGIVQCKAWTTYKVGIKLVKELFGTMADERTPIGVFMTSGEFTSEAITFARGKMNLVTGKKLIELIKDLPEDQQQWLLDVALEGDYRTPTCPQCDVKMVLRESTTGRNAGNHFWGCPRYPRCKQTLVYKDVCAP